MELQILLFLSQSRSQAPRCLLQHHRVQYFRKKKKFKCYCTITNLVLSLLYPFCFPRHFFPSLTDLHIWLSPSPCPMLHVYTISMTANSGNFSCRLPASDSSAQGTLPPSASGGPPVLSLTLYSLLHQPPPPTLPLLPTTSLSSSTLFPSAFCSPCNQWKQELAHSLCLASPLYKHCPEQVASPTLLLQQQSFHPSTDLSACLPPPEGKAGGRHGSMKGLSWRCWVWQKKMNTDVSCSFSVPQKFAAPSSCSSTPHHSDPLPLGCCRVGLLSPPPVFLLLSPSSHSSNHKGAGVMHLLNSELQARQETLPPLPSCTATSFLHPSPEGDTFCSTPLKSGSYVFNSFKKWIASGWGGGPGARKDIIQQDLLSDKDSAQNRYLMTVYLQIMWPYMTNLKRY